MYKFEIEKMGCMNCVQHFEEELKKLDGAIRLKPNLKTRILEVETTVAREEVKRVIVDAGFKVKDLN